LVLCGVPGSGKSTFASRFIEQHGLPSTTIVSSDHCRALICDDDTNQQVSRDAFDLFHYIIYKRMSLGRFIIADSTALLSNARHRLLAQARNYSYATCLLVFTVDPAICIQRDLDRHRIVG
ncbi:MAG TPA: polynucleotide kinase-phosphatase, partial [Ktedonobacter sp.]|nr:polynucleotide kinase-phosphatase [Ktedonobacter sp.]